ncbi:MAG: hypothetical protein AABY64_13270 [Bdellovibrionota bacterium]
MSLNKITTVILSLTIAVQAPHPYALAVDSSKSKIPTSPTDEHPPWLEDLRDRFGFVANGLKLLKNITDIDAAVGKNPWTLRPDTLASIQFLPLKIRLGLAQFITTNIGRMLVDDQDSTAFDRAGPPTQFYSDVNLSVDFTLTDEMSRELLRTALINQLKKVLTNEQIVDLSVFLLSKASFFPRENDWDAWNKIKQQIVYYDIYLILVYILATLAIDKTQIVASGYLFKVKGDTFRVGWYGGLKNFGIHLKRPEFKAGFKIKSETLETNLGVTKRLSPEERTAFEAKIILRILSEFLKPRGWGSEASFNGTYFFSDQSNPGNEGRTFIGFSSTINSEKLRENGSLTLALQNSASVDTAGHPSAATTAILTDEKYGFQASANFSIGQEGRDNRTHLNTRVGLIGSYQWEGGAKHLKYSITADANTIRSLMQNIARLKAEEKTSFTDANLAMHRHSLKRSVASYIEGIKRMKEILPPTKRYFLLTDHEFAHALVESEKEITVDQQTQERTQLMMERLYFHN